MASYYLNATRPFKEANGTIECHVPHQQIYVANLATCFFIRLPFVMEDWYFAYISAILNLILIISSIFIKKSYKYFFINIALWDLFAVYDFVCDRPTKIWYTMILPEIRKSWGQQDPTCFYIAVPTPNLYYTIMEIIRLSFKHGPFGSILLLALSRFLSMYFNNFYSKISTPIKTTVIILIYGILYILVLSSGFLFSQIEMIFTVQKCNTLCPNNLPECATNYSQCVANDLRSNKGDIRDFFVYSLEFIYPPVILILTVFFMSGTFLKVALQLRLQAKLKQKLVFSSFKIAIVLGFQTFTLSLIFMNSYFFNFAQNILYIWHLTIVWPMWFTQIPPKCLTILRSIADTFIALVVLTEYREAVIFGCKYGIKVTLQPLIWLKIWTPKTRSSDTSLFRKTSNSPRANMQ